MLTKGDEYPNQICNLNDKSTPLHFAVLSSQHQNSKILISNGANPNMQDASGNTPMHYAVLKKDLPMIRLLNDNGASGTVKNMDGSSPIDLAVMEDYRDIMMYFTRQPEYANYDMERGEEVFQAQQNFQGSGAYTTIKGDNINIPK